MSPVDESSLTREGLVEAAAIVDRLANANPAGSKEREALLVGASLIRSHATRPDDAHPALDRWFHGVRQAVQEAQASSVLPSPYLKGAEAMVAAVGTLTGEITKATNALRRLTDAVNRSTNFR